jgi:hypothetical protein
MPFRRLRIIFPLVIVTAIILVHGTACRKELPFINTPVALAFSQDTIIFDTVFTTIGSVTHWLKVYNKEKQPVQIDHIYLAGGGSSPFRINIDGLSTTSIKGYELAAGDSMYVFIEVTVDPNNSNSPLVITDSIVFINKGNIQDVKLVAWGQDAHFIVPDKRIGNIHYRIVAGVGESVDWSNDKPYVVYGYAVVDSAALLRIGEGTRIHFHNNSGLWVYKGGCIKVNGTAANPVYFQGDRMDPWYRDQAGQWDRIWINEGSQDNEFNYAIIRNGFIGIQAEILGSATGNRLILNNTIIDNMSGRGLFTRGYTVEATNCLITNSGDITVYLAAGGSYDFRHTTIANYWSLGGARQVPALVIANYEENLGLGFILTGDLVKAYFGNCIIYGSNKEEYLTLNKYGGAFNYQFDHCLIKSSTKPADHPGRFLNCIIRNQDSPSYNPGEKIFRNQQEGDWRPDSLSVVVDYGSINVIQQAPVTPNTIIQFDLPGESRLSDAGPDLGAIEFVPQR